jgi:hypothetical protein
LNEVIDSYDLLWLILVILEQKVKIDVELAPEVLGDIEGT